MLACTADVDVNEPDEKSIMTYVAQFLQYSNDMPAPDDHLQVGNQTITADLTSLLSVNSASSPLGSLNCGVVARLFLPLLPPRPV